MLYEKYEPRSTREFIGNARQVVEVRAWLKKPDKPMLLAGFSGVGKSLLIKLLAKEANYEILDSADLAELTRAARERSLFYRDKLLILDADQLRSLRGVSDLMKETKQLIIVTSDAYEKRLSNIRRACRLVRMDRPRCDQIAAFLKRVCRTEKLSCDDAAIDKIAKRCSGDIRAALIDLESGVLDAGSRNIEENIFELLRRLSSSDIGEARGLLSRADLDQVMFWLEENIPAAGSIEDIAAAYESLAKADLFGARIIKRQSWSLQKYRIALIAGSSPRRNIIYKYPSFSGRRRDIDPLLEKIGRRLHVSKKKAKQYLGIIKLLYSKDRDTAKTFGFDQEELKALK